MRAIKATTVLPSIPLKLSFWKTTVSSFTGFDSCDRSKLNLNSRLKNGKYCSFGDYLCAQSVLLTAF